MALYQSRSIYALAGRIVGVLDSPRMTDRDAQPTAPESEQWLPDGEGRPAAAGRLARSAQRTATHPCRGHGFGLHLPRETDATHTSPAGCHRLLQARPRLSPSAAGATLPAGEGHLASLERPPFLPASGCGVAHPRWSGRGGCRSWRDREEWEGGGSSTSPRCGRWAAAPPLPPNGRPWWQRWRRCRRRRWWWRRLW